MGDTLAVCGGPCKSNGSKFQSERQFNTISPYYTEKITEDIPPANDMPHYSELVHIRLYCLLNKYGLKFTDMVYPKEDLVQNREFEWKHISSVFPNVNIAADSNNFFFEYNSQSAKSPYANRNFITAMNLLKRFPDLVKKIFTNLSINSVGFYPIYFAIGGDIESRKQIIIDDYIPVDKNGNYFGAYPEGNGGIWMILIEKALAKVLGSYFNIDFLSPDQIFSEITGVPIPSTYRNGDYLNSLKFVFYPEESKYLKFGICANINMIIAIWEPLHQIQNNYEKKKEKPSKFVIEMIHEGENRQFPTYEICPLKMKRISNKLILCGESDGPFELKEGKYIFHIFNRDLECKQFNLVTHANRAMSNPIASYSPVFPKVKHIMIKTMYQKLHNKLNVLYDHPGIAVRFVWIGHRAIFCLKNETSAPKKIRFQILNNQIFFEDHANERAQEITINPQEHGFFIMFRRSDCEYGRFYSIKIQPS